MIVLGLHLGHDATACVMADGTILSMIEKERIVRIKHAGLMNIDLINVALECAKVDIGEIDFVAITQTQNWPTVFFDTRDFSFEIDHERSHELNLGVGGERRVLAIKEHQESWNDWARRRFELSFLSERGRESGYGFYLADEFDPASEYSKVIHTSEFPIFPSIFTDGFSTRKLFRFDSEITKTFMPDNKNRVRYHLPLSVNICGRKIPGAQFPHHLAHAAVAHYQSDQERSAILTVDNGHCEQPPYGYTGGLYCIGNGTQLGVLGPNFAFHGHVYNRMGMHLGWRSSAASGKLMGLAPYGEASFYDPAMVGDYESVFNFDNDTSFDGWETTKDYCEFILTHSKDRGYSPYIPDPENVLSPISVDIAASTQLFFEESTAYFSTVLKSLCDRAGFQPQVLGLSGGCALNCPSNSLLHRIGRFPKVFVPPSVDDSGLALGAAFLTTHDLFDIPRVKQDPHSSASAYLGREWNEGEVKRSIDANLSEIEVEECSHAAHSAADDLVNDNIIAWFEGRSEIGPRALGNRSILANPTNKGNWRRTNDIKKREQWRPFAPAVLEEKNDEWFEGAPSVSPFMLFTAQVKGKRLPAVTHVDGSARVQTVAKNCGGFRKLLEHLDERSGIGVVLNTSFNGPGEPIVDTPQEAIDFLKTSNIDLLYLQGYKLKNKKINAKV